MTSNGFRQRRTGLDGEEHRGDDRQTGFDLGWTRTQHRSSKHGEILAWLKETHGIGHGYANFIAREALKSDEEGGDDGLLAAQFAGPKAALRPIYDQLIKVVTTLGPDVEIASKKNNVSIRHGKQFALLQPSTATRW